LDHIGTKSVATQEHTWCNCHGHSQNMLVIELSPTTEYLFLRATVGHENRMRTCCVGHVKMEDVSTCPWISSPTLTTVAHLVMSKKRR